MNPPDAVFEHADAAAAAIRAIVPEFPATAIVLGSGLGTFADALTDAISIPYGSIPHFPIPTVSGHHGVLKVGFLNGLAIAALQGRFHYYEGHDIAAVTFPVRVLRRLGVRTLILTAAVGAITPTITPGDLVMLSDHLNLLRVNPLHGPNDEMCGPRFPDMSAVYSEALRAEARSAASALRLPLREGVYACLSGPSYETPAEIRMLRTLGADVVGMSTVPEAIVARHGGMDVLAFAVASNWAAGMSPRPITHQELLEAGNQAGPRLVALVSAVLPHLDTPYRANPSGV